MTINHRNKIIRKILFLFLFAISAVPDYSLAEAIEGKWKMFDGASKEPVVVVKLKLDGNELKGTITELFPQPGEEPAPKCTKCEGAKKDQPFLGMEIIWGLKPTDTEGKFQEGYLLTPDDGQIFRCKMALVTDGKNLKVSIYKGLPIFGSTINWVREP